MSAPIPVLIEMACRRVAPSWPLDQAIAVNPYIGFLDMSIREAASLLRFIAESPLLMPHEWYGEEAGSDSNMPVMRCFIDLIDEQRGSEVMTCRSIVVNSISQHCASYFDRKQSQWQPQRNASLYESWRENIRVDLGPSLLSGIANIGKALHELPKSAEATIERALRELHIPSDCTEAYLLCLLYRINGWASWCAYLDRTDDGYYFRRELLAMYIAYEWAFSRCGNNQALKESWNREQKSWHTLQRNSCTDSRWKLQANMESAYQADVHEVLLSPCNGNQKNKTLVQAIFCIDVRSEVYRRVLENCSDATATLGTAGFFGLPTAYLPVGADKPRSQVVPLIAPKYLVEAELPSNANGQKLIKKRQIHLSRRRLFSEWKRSSVSKFSFVESFGLLFGFAMVSHTWNAHAPNKRDLVGISERRSLKPRIVGLADADAISLAENILRGMSLVRSFAPIVCMIGHEGCTANNPQASSLDCGACGGQSGELNARAVAELLNRPLVRAGLISRGIQVPETTWFCSGVHNTSDDEITLHADDVPQLWRAQLAEFETTLSLARPRVRLERDPFSAVPAFHWANVRPEWGLARNASIIIAPRSRTSKKSLSGRAFLQEYTYTDDSDGSILRSILGGPLTVAHWISMQYYASTVDPNHFGSGNKLLHNVVGGSIGVFEGNGGDLRIGVSHQALYNGENLLHTPLRLAAWIEAPREFTAREILSQDSLCRMLAGDWLTVFTLDPSNTEIYQARVSAGEGGVHHLTWEPALQMQMQMPLASR